MSNHRIETPRRKRSGRTRALISLGAVAVLATGMSVKGTFAFWTDAATVNTGTFSSGSLDITVNGQLSGQANNGGNTTVASLALSNMVPGESLAGAFPVANAGTVPLTYSLAATGTGDLAPTLQFSVYVGASAAASNPTPGANGIRTGSCTGTLLTTADRTYSSTSTQLVTTAAPRSLTVSGPTASESICVVAKLPTTADNTTQGKSMSASLVFSASQLGAS